MSTHRSRNNNRQQSQQIINSPMTPPKTFAKGIVIPIILDIVICVALCIGKSLINKHTYIHFPARTIPLLILAAFLAAILIVVSYVIKQYKYLHNTYQMLEQGMTVAAELNAHQGDFVEYSANPPYYNNGYNNSVPVPQNRFQSTAQTNRNSQSSSSNSGCGMSLMIIFLITIIAGLLIYRSFPQSMDIKSCSITAGTVTEVITSVYRDDEEETSYTTYYVDYEYFYAGKKYTGHDSLNTSVQKGEQLDVIVDSSDPQYSVLAAKITYIVMMWGIAVIIIFVIGLFIGASTRKRR